MVNLKRKDLWIYILIVMDKILVCQGSTSAPNNPTVPFAQKSTPTPNQEQDYENEVTIDGAINEKPRIYQTNDSIPNRPSTTSSRSRSSFDATQHLSHHLHALVGLDRYPNYLSRWSLQDIHSLEKSMLKQLQKVKDQKHSIEQQRQFLTELIDDVLEHDKNSEEDYLDLQSLLNVPMSWDQIREEMLDPHASQVIFNSKWFSKTKNIPTVNQVIHGEIDIHLDDFLLESWMDQEMFDIYSFPLLSKNVGEKESHAKILVFFLL